MGTAPLESSVSQSKQLVILIHGIRTEAIWEDLVAQILRTIPSVDVRPISYGYFDVFRFICPFITRGGPIRRIERELRAVREDQPEIPISIIAHSFGTYAVSHVLEDNPDIRLNRLVLCGSIIPRTFRWDKIRRQVEHRVINDCGERDIWPLIAKSASWGYGASGTLGFGCVDVIDRFHPFTHSEFFRSNVVKQYWLPLFAKEDIVFPSHPRTPPRWWQTLLARIPFQWIIATIGLAAALASGIHVVAYQGPHSNASRAAVAPPNTQHLLRSLLEPTYIASDRSEPDSFGLRRLQSKIAILRANPTLKLRLEGNTDSNHEPEYALALGQREAAAIKSILVAGGVKPDRLDIESLGGERLLDSAYDQAAISQFSWNPNRRVEYAIKEGSAANLRAPLDTETAIRLQVSTRHVRLFVGEQSQVSAFLLNPFGDAIPMRTIGVISGDPSVAAVDQSGRTWGVGPGETSLEFVSGSLSETVQVVVRSEDLLFSTDRAAPQWRNVRGSCHPEKHTDDDGVVTYSLTAPSGRAGRDCLALIVNAGSLSGDALIRTFPWTNQPKVFGWAGFVFGASSRGESYYYVASRGGGDHVEVALFRHLNNAEELLVPWLLVQPSDVKMEPTVLAIELVSHDIAIYANGERLLRYTLPVTSAGHLGFVRQGATPNIRFEVFQMQYQ